MHSAAAQSYTDLSDVEHEIANAGPGSTFDDLKHFKLSARQLLPTRFVKRSLLMSLKISDCKFYSAPTSEHAASFLHPNGLTTVMDELMHSNKSIPN